MICAFPGMDLTSSYTMSAGVGVAYEGMLAFVFVCLHVFMFGLAMILMTLSAEYGTLRLKDLVRCAVPRVAPKWDEVGLQLDIQPYVLRNIEADGGDVVTRCKNMFSKWLIGEAGTGDLQRTWESVLEAVREAVGSEVCSNVEQSISQGEL